MSINIHSKKGLSIEPVSFRIERTLSLLNRAKNDSLQTNLKTGKHSLSSRGTKRFEPH